MLQKIFPLLFLIFTTTLFSQNKSGEIGILIDNDLFTSTVNDQYYTNGIEIFYRFLNQNENLNINKKITEIKFGQYIYNPHTVEAASIRKHDRPFAGYLFVEAGLHKFYQNESVFKMTGQVGVIGQSSGAEEFQKLFHKAFGYKDVEGWNYQIHNALAVQGNLFYSKKIFPSKFSQNVDFSLQGEANFGTVLNGITAGPLARFSLKKLLPIYDSNLHNASLSADKSKYKEQSEFYFYINPNVNYQVYDATIQGSMFNNDSPVTFDLRPLRFYGEAGFKYRKNHWNLHYVFVYRSKEVDNIRNEGYFYGSIGASYLLY
ncbi:lipid A deacylase LpxR family protein [uncultured Flavobacterium sp.]|uniref:lipid A deacylase LpxR family protein n=1 Tax=uncultured Flavobacterium sp. TaxID=165435 RepID=UPI0025E9930A|nr:lipid A deacylase LpxR family protein [uncultured Flavobacterium sp.]